MRHIVIGGGVAGVSCAEELCRLVPQDTVTLVAADKVLKGVSTVSRITRNIEVLKVEEKQLDALPYPNLTMVQDVATGIDIKKKELLLARHAPLPYDKLCICAGARPKQLAAGIDSPHIITLRDTESLQALCARLEGSRRVMVVGNGAIALEAVFALRGMEVVWVMKHGHIGDAIFDIDAAQFLLEEMQQAEQGAQHAQQGAERQAGPGRPQQPPGDSGGGTPGAQQGQQRAGATTVRRGTPMQQQGCQQAHHPGTLGHAVGPSWVAALPHAEGETRVLLEYGCFIEEIVPRDSCLLQMQQQEGQQESSRPRLSQADGAAVPGSSCREADRATLEVHSHQSVGAGGGVEEGGVSALCISSSHAAPGPPGSEQKVPIGAASGASQPAAAAAGHDRPWNLLVQLTNGKQYGVDLIISAVGVTPALDWVPQQVERAKDGGLAVDRCMETSLPGVYAAGDSCSAQWAAEDSPHWFQMRLWTQARSMGVYAAHCMAGVQDQTGVAMAFELFTHATRFMGHKVVLLGLYNGQRLEAEPPEDVVTYSRVTEGPERTFVRVLLLRGRVQGAVLIGDTDLEETMENLILDQLDVGGYGPGLLDPDVELDHVFD